MIVVLDWKCLETPLPDMAAGAEMTVVATHVRSHQPLHPPTEVSVFIPPRQQVKMIGHQAVAGQPYRNSLVSFAHQRDESEKVVWFMEDIATPVPAIENVINKSTLRCSCCSGHSIRLAHAKSKTK